MNLARPIGLTMIAALALAGCDKPGGTATAADAAPAASVPAATRAAPDFIVGPDGVRDVRIGMTLAEVEALGHRATAEPAEEGMTCTYATISGMGGIGVMLESGRIVRFDVSWPPVDTDKAVSGMEWRTAEGIGLASTEADLRAVYGQRMQIETNKYDERWRDIIVRTEGSNRALLFQTDGSTVQAWRAGDWDAVQLVEGCS